MDIKVKARLNHGRWIADCPECTGAELVNPGGIFTCSSGEHPARTFEVEFPAEFVMINAAVRRRPLANRNWEVGQTLEDLIQENQEHGL